MRSSRAIASSQPISMPGTFQFGRSLKAYHKSPIMIPIPQLVEASTNIRRSWRGFRGRNCLKKSGICNCDDHHSSDSRKELETRRVVVVLPLYWAMVLEIIGRRDDPETYTKHR